MMPDSPEMPDEALADGPAEKAAAELGLQVVEAQEASFQTQVVEAEQASFQTQALADGPAEKAAAELVLQACRRRLPPTFQAAASGEDAKQAAAEQTEASECRVWGGWETFYMCRPWRGILTACLTRHLLPFILTQACF
eukprot:g4204.t1